jgi:bud emergence protein 1
VIKALYDYNAPDARYLSFSQGDFLHVVDREDDTQWYEACNPLQNTRGLVPVSYFEIVGKQARNSAETGGHIGHDSGYGSQGGQRGSNQPGMVMPMNIGAMPGPTGSPGPGAAAAAAGLTGSGAMVYGVVMYDFKAERPDELEAKEGEAIIVIAQSNPEWFVAKPITRLGGPGLIPVSFVEIRDMATNEPVGDQQEAIKRAGVPKVEEWKKMAADYKNGSIPLGKLDSGAAQLSQGMSRMSLGQQSQMQQQQNQMMGQANPYPSMNGFNQVNILLLNVMPC